MNFLEQLTAEWYQYQGYFVRTNAKFGRRPNGGYIGEMDVIGYRPSETETALPEFIHIECSTDADKWPDRKVKFEKKFTDARRYYQEIFPFKTINIRPKQLAIVGFNLKPTSIVNYWKSTEPPNSIWGDIRIVVINIPRFFQLIQAELKNKNPQKDAVPESYPLLRAIQYSAFYNK